MRKNSYICDHCGRELDGMRDFTDMKIDTFLDYIETDLCDKCFHELNDMVLQFANKKKDTNKENKL